MRWLQLKLRIIRTSLILEAWEICKPQSNNPNRDEELPHLHPPPYEVDLLGSCNLACAGSPEKVRGRLKTCITVQNWTLSRLMMWGQSAHIAGLVLGRYHPFYGAATASWNTIQLRSSDIPSQHRSNPHDSSSGKYVWSYHRIVSFQSRFLRRRNEKYLVPLAQSPWVLPLSAPPLVSHRGPGEPLVEKNSSGFVGRFRRSVASCITRACRFSRHRRVLLISGFPMRRSLVKATMDRTLATRSSVHRSAIHMIPGSTTAVTRLKGMVTRHATSQVVVPAARPYMSFVWEISSYVSHTGPVCLCFLVK